MTLFRKRAASAALAFCAVFAGPVSFAGPQEALALAKEQLADNDCAAAASTLGEAIPEAQEIEVANERDAALTALHFYGALAQSNCSQQEKAREHLREFFRLKPGQSSLDASRYPRAFVALFDDVQRGGMQRDSTRRGSDELFDRFYPGFDEYRAAGEEAISMALWSTSPAFQLLAEDAEREEWARLRDDEARAEFVDRFWTRRDADSSTAANELRDDVARRIAFADRFFSVPNELRGSMSDRGRVFVLLGPPARVHRQALQRYETTLVSPRVRTPLTGTLERWVYFQSQLPDLAVQQIEFQFITQPGYGEYVMQRDFWPLKALAAAREPRR